MVATLAAVVVQNKFAVSPALHTFHFRWHGRDAREACDVHLMVKASQDLTLGHMAAAVAKNGSVMSVKG